MIARELLERLEDVDRLGLPVRIVVDEPFADDAGTDLATTREVLDLVYIEAGPHPWYALYVGPREWLTRSAATEQQQ